MEVDGDGEDTRDFMFNLSVGFVGVALEAGFVFVFIGGPGVGVGIELITEGR